MLNLFSLDDNYNLTILPEAFGLIPFKNVIKKYKNNEYAIVELLYIYYMVDYRSDYRNIPDDRLKSKTILDNLYNSDKIKIDKVTQDAIDFYNERQPSISFKHLASMKKALKNLQDSLDTIDLSMQVTDIITGELKPVYNTMDLNRIATIMKDSPKIIAAIKEMEKQVVTELQESTGHRGSGEKSIYEDD